MNYPVIVIRAEKYLTWLDSGKIDGRGGNKTECLG